MQLVCPNKCRSERNGNIGFLLVGVPITVHYDLTIDVNDIYGSISNIRKGLIPGAKLLCSGCHENAIVEE
jgi:hypothetical protein